jgi:hypothetical protein
MTTLKWELRFKWSRSRQTVKKLDSGTTTLTTAAIIPANKNLNEPEAECFGRERDPIADTPSLVFRPVLQAISSSQSVQLARGRLKTETRPV